MNLKHAIVVKNQYTVKMKSGGGSRGSSPGNYIKKYMARERAVETLVPVRLRDVDSYVRRYELRREAADTGSDVASIKKDMRDAQKYGGVAFGYGCVSLSDEKFREASRDIQDCFDAGHTVMKTILSFDEEYLRERKIISDDFHAERRGDYRGHIDQMKLRLAIMNGLEKLSRSYDDLQYVGIIQLDTKHVHCHLAMVDRGRGTLANDGSQVGKITERGKKILRRGIDDYLSDVSMSKMLSGTIMYDRQNAVGHVRRFTYRAVSSHSLPQFLIACLPEDRSLWRAGTNRTEMKKANTIVREYVMDILSDSKSSYREAMAGVMRYADARTEREGLSVQEHDALVFRGRERIVQSCMNSVYDVLRNVPESDLVVRTPMLDVMSMDYESMAAAASDDPMVDFGFRLRSYSARLSYHKKEYHRNLENLQDYDAAENKSPDSAPLGEFFRYETEYNRSLMIKYQHFLTFIPPEDGVLDDLEVISGHKKRMRKLKEMAEDEDLKQVIDPDSAERMGIEKYGEHGGRYLGVNPALLQARIDSLEEQIQQEEDAFSLKLLDYGMVYDGVSVKKQLSEPFEDVKALDIHHLDYDFSGDIPVSKKYVDQFVREADTRYRLYLQARQYLIDSDQAEALSELAGRDVTVMHECADAIRVSGLIVSKRSDEWQRHRGRTIPLHEDYNEEMESAVRVTIQSSIDDVSYLGDTQTFVR